MVRSHQSDAPPLSMDSDACPYVDGNHDCCRARFSLDRLDHLGADLLWRVHVMPESLAIAFAGADTERVIDSSDHHAGDGIRSMSNFDQPVRDSTWPI